MVKAISGVMTVRFKNELVRNITIKLGYANAKVRHPSDAMIRPLIVHRYTNVKTRHARGQDVTDHIGLTRRRARLVSGPDAIRE